MTLVLTGPPPTWKPQLEAADLQNVKRGVEYGSPSPGIAVTRMGNGDWFYAVDTTAANRTVTLPDVAEAAGQTHIVKRISGGANSCTITAAAGLLDGEAAHSIAAQYGVRGYFSDGEAWRGTGPNATAGTGDVASGTYTPTLAGTLNVDAVANGAASYIRVGNIVQVAGQFDVDPTAAGATGVGISLPIASNLGASSDLHGIGSGGVEANGRVFGDAANDRAMFNFNTTLTSSHTVFFMFAYRVL
ncbi:hypothetical protein [Reyranella sp. CPCC 100927]|uniref:hypothetical protein n=1 Tax=Reyranella sp. CPCC 100927 TaxID=2599616 RepID=UPI0011B7CDA2|nr:hypothetical protein [Reyranella sp. CPCC 100927]TWT11714.1 hypothetical protein FQU96_14665 [Reyranella sp. CPCC 100927]